jgi:hypothetical protein
MDKIHQPFEGFCEIHLIETSHFIETEEEPLSFIVWFYKRETEESSLEEFLRSIQPNNFGWDQVSNQLYFKDQTNNLHFVNFTPL